MKLPVIAPTATYRIQFNSDLPFKKAADLVDYLNQLGISDVYASPLFKARPGSRHGYDVVNHAEINPDLGTHADFDKYAARLRTRKMGLIMDIVPNHMCITDPANVWWSDLLENGPSSPFADYFDINWKPEKDVLHNKVLLPFLGDQYGRVLENGDIQIKYEKGSFFAHYFHLRVPIALKSTVLILEDILNRCKKQGRQSESTQTEILHLIRALHRLPSRTEADPETVERRRQTKHLRSDLLKLCETNSLFKSALEDSLRALNGVKGKPESFNRLEKLLDEQGYRLSFWRVASDEINYRRFFDINELAAIRIEHPDVFKSVHQLALDGIKKNVVTGLRIDHVDGLYDPKTYLIDLQRVCAAARNKKEQYPYYTVVEKILGSSERLRSDWPVSGTTGYEFLNYLNGLFVNPANKGPFLKLYKRFTGLTGPFYDVICDCKEMITHVSNASELYVLASQLERISGQHRYSRDFTFEGLRYALREIIACFPVYRSYVQHNSGPISAEDQSLIQSSINAAIKRNPAVDPSIFEFVKQVLLWEDPPGLTENQLAERREFVMKFQQLTGPVMAKGLEDTASYRYYPLASLNEVGGAADRFGVSIHEFHAQNQERQKNWPQAMLATTTHDTKRSEDVRARLNVLSEIPAPWYRTLRRWAAWNQDKKTMVDGRPAPDSNEEYLLYQSLIGTWPILPMTPAALKAYVERIEAYMIKALREAKIHTSWVNVNQSYENAVRVFTRSILTRRPRNRFEADIKKSIKPIIKAGRLNSLSQTFLKMTCPGVPDFYQGTEMLNFSLVDPDNRRPVPFASLKTALHAADRVSLRKSKQWIRYLMRRPVKGRIKLFVISRTLQFRRKNPDLFSRGDYVPMTVHGPKTKNVIAFARLHGNRAAIAVAARFFMDIDNGDGKSFRSTALQGTTLSIPKKLATGAYRDIFTGTIIKFNKTGRTARVPVLDLLTHLPIVLLEKI